MNNFSNKKKSYILLSGMTDILSPLVKQERMESREIKNGENMQISWHLSFANRYNYMKEWAAHTLKRSWEEAWGKVEKFYSKAA